MIFLSFCIAANCLIGFFYTNFQERLARFDPTSRFIVNPIKISKIPNDHIKTLILGDFTTFRIFSETGPLGPSILNLATICSTTMAAQYFLLQNSVKNLPNLREAYLIIHPVALRYSIDDEVGANDFCSYYYEPRQIWDVFRYKKSIPVALRQLVSLAFPYLRFTNVTTGAITEKLRAASSPSNSIHRHLSPVFRVELGEDAKYYLEKMRLLCRQRGIRFKVIFEPVSDHIKYVGWEGIFDSPPRYYPDAQFSDHIHTDDSKYYAKYRRDLLESLGIQR